MKVIIVGAGVTGIRLARRLIQEKHTVSLIEPDEEKARHTSNRLDCMVLHGDGNNLSVLEEAGIAKAEALVCAGDSDEMNMIICGLASSKYPKLFKIAYVRNYEYTKLGVMGIDCIIHPDIEAAKAVLRALSHGALGNIIEFEDITFKLGSVIAANGSTFDGLCLKDYRSLVSSDSLIVLLERDLPAKDQGFPSREFILPSGTTVIKGGDRVHILADESKMESIFMLAGIHEKPLQRIGIAGGGRIGTLVAEGILRKKTVISGFLQSLLPRRSRRVIIIDHNYNVCKELAARFPEALVLNENISDESFIAEEQLDGLDLIIASTENQEVNIITSIYLKSLGVKRAIAMVTGRGYENIAMKLGIDVVIPKEQVIVDAVYSNLFGKGVREIHSLGDGSLEILKLEVEKDSPADGKPITSFKLTKGALILLVNRDEISFIPKGDYVFNSYDKIILLVNKGSEKEIEDFFAPSVFGRKDEV